MDSTRIRHITTTIPPLLEVVPNGGTFARATEVNLRHAASGISGVVVHYTSDGTDPTSASASYSGPLTISRTSTLKARLFVNGNPVSPIVAAHFTIQSDATCIAPPPGLAGWWPGDGHGREVLGGSWAVLSNGAGFAEGFVEEGFNLDGLDDRVVIPSRPEYNFGPGADLTIEAWIKVNPGNQRQLITLFDKRYHLPVVGGVPLGDATGYALYLWEGRLSFQLGDAPPVVGGYADYRSAEPDLRDGRFHHVAVAVERNQPSGGRLYVDGQVVMTFDPRGQPGDLSNEEPIHIGNHPLPGVGSFLDGVIDEISLYRRALSEAEVAALVEAGRRGKCKPALPPPSRILVLGGDDDYARISSAPPLQPVGALTVELWLYPHQVPVQGTKYFLAKGDGQLGVGSARTYDLSWTPEGRLFFSLYLGQSTWALLGTVAAPRRWTHLAASYDSATGEFRLFTNGVLAASTTTDVTGQFSLKGQTLRQTGAPLILGGYPGIAGSFAAGYLDEVRIWARALSAAELSANLYRRLTGSEAHLAAYWNFDDGSVRDLTGRGYDGTLLNGATTQLIPGVDLVHGEIGFTSFNFTRRGWLMLGLSTPPGTALRIEASRDLREWQVIGRIRSETGVAQFTDADTLNFETRFYRAVKE
ncbi:MAG: LamG-like jellyroll fold domain-containing protein [Verrucomicrobiales bacterium]|nr:LamG-like jellyroll fold domain-containing protein [Verrucomicrobiales bacterium]